jgi:hypothetical protein
MTNAQKAQFLRDLKAVLDKHGIADLHAIDYNDGVDIDGAQHNFFIEHGTAWLSWYDKEAKMQRECKFKV